MAGHDHTRAVLLLGACLALGCGDVSPASVAEDGGVDAGALDASGLPSGSGGGPATSGGGGGGGVGGESGGAGGSAGGLVGGDCRSVGDCTSVAGLCLAPDESPGCGVCRQPTSTCEVDDDCAGRGKTWICDLAPCSCTDVKSCVSGCEDNSGCGPSQFCAANHRCVGDVCTPSASDRSCLPNFTCGTDGHCARKQCVSDDDCQGACVKGLCYLRPGTCTPPPA